MRVRAIYCVALGLAGLLSGTLEQAVAADDLSKRNNLHVTRPHAPRHPDDSFSRMFPGLPPYAPQTDEAREQAKRLGVKEGIIDAQDLLTDPKESILNPAVHSPNNADNADMTAGVTFFGQFLDHDLTLALKAPILEQTNPRRTTNFRTAEFDLDSLYGNGPDRSPELYDTGGGNIKFKVEAIPGSEAVSRKGAARFDLPRDANDNAIIADSRNDENVLLSQFHLAMLKFHNAVTDRILKDPTFANRSDKDVFNEAQRQVRWHYQWIIVNEFLPMTIGQERVNDILRNGTRFYNVTDRNEDGLLRNAIREPLIPVEFAVAAYRFGHSQVRPSYRVNFGAAPGNEFFAFVFDDSADPNDPDPNDMRGGKRAARRFVDWQTFFDFGDGNVRPNKKIDTKLSTPLMHLLGSRGPAPGMPSDGIQSLASRNLMRHVNFGIPSGQAIARVMNARVLSPAQLAELAPFGMEKSTPLWYYILKEAEVFENGRRLGPVGSRIVGEVFIGLLRADRDSYLSANRNWKPTLPSAKAGDFEITDLLNFAGVVPPLN
ncbi:peroxidase family protein [Candidatus Nitrospira nitrificans]|uniref:Myeloperoxidase, thyroid peroxidase, cyclooxygenase catalytic domain n=1 Tax=Candidatus Nitrospira nitrificans TaxID=1742973 RepID=A0A0S4LAC1_9BACT|nr:heme peroxidase family protein [Candidatus Nitrospira nitrificans]CUS34657.1 Myeloperoxidase, thyroid peroxidase, cyclooxygenase catalytic domain [Candidatus Nitrospira nitrificans]